MNTFFLTILAREAGYLDPGSGSFLIQLLIGGLIGLLFAIKTFWGQIKTFFSERLGKTPEPATPSVPATPENQDDN